MAYTFNQQSSLKKTVAETLQCPVCYQLPVPPIYGCQNGHIICDSCKENVQHCPVCRSEKFNVRNIVVEELICSSILKCPFDGCGRSSRLMTGSEYTEHVKNCEFRQIECHCKVGIAQCDGQLYNKSEYFDHINEFHGSRLGRTIQIVKCDMEGPFNPTYFSHFGKNFILLSHRDGTKFWTWVAIDSDAGQPELYLKITLRYNFEKKELTFPSDIFQPVSIRDTPDEVLKSGHCLEFSVDTAPPSLPPYIWPGYVEADDEEGGFIWGYDVEISQAQVRHKRRCCMHKAGTQSNNNVINQGISMFNDDRAGADGNFVHGPIRNIPRVYGYRRNQEENHNYPTPSIPARVPALTMTDEQHQESISLQSMQESENVVHGVYTFHRILNNNSNNNNSAIRDINYALETRTSHQSDPYNESSDEDYIDESSTIQNNELERGTTRKAEETSGSPSSKRMATPNIPSTLDDMAYDLDPPYYEFGRSRRPQPK